MEKKRTVYLSATDNKLLNERLNNGDVIEGVLEINAELNEASFTEDDRIAFQFDTCVEMDDGILLSGTKCYYRFSYKVPERVTNNGK